MYVNYVNQEKCLYHICASAILMLSYCEGRWARISARLKVPQGVLCNKMQTWLRLFENPMLIQNFGKKTCGLNCALCPPKPITCLPSLDYGQISQFSSGSTMTELQSEELNLTYLRRSVFKRR